MNNPIKTLTKKEWLLWLGSLLIVVISNIMTGEIDILTLAAALIGATSLIFAAKGNVWAQILMIIFCILYGIISWKFHYWGEMITYLGMSMPMAVWSTITWSRNSKKSNGSYALGYASNDIVLIILWVMASIKDPSYFPVVVNFMIFFLNDMYGFISWKKREERIEEKIEIG